jgi:hypothetical protein
MSLGFEGKLISELNQVHDIWSMPIAMEIQDAWFSAPNNLANRIMSIAGSGSKEIRSPLWELYLWRSLSAVHESVEYEPREISTENVIDFRVRTKTGYEFMVEATSFGPKEEDLLISVSKNNPERYLEIREIFKKKLNQIQKIGDIPVVLAFCNSHMTDFNTKFEKIQILYGAPAIQFDKVTMQESLVLNDLGFWYPDESNSRSFDAIFFGRGYLPGFSSKFDEELWLNPISDHPLNHCEFKLGQNYFKSDDDLFMTNSRLGFEWVKSAIF